MEIQERNSEDIKKLTQDFAMKLLNVQKEKKNLDLDIKELKEEFKLNGVDVSKTIKAINNIKKRLKQSALDAADEQIVEEYLTSSDDINLNIHDLVSGN